MKSEFNNKAKDYAKGRPTYPVEILDKLKELGVTENSTIADIGAGTGLLTNMLGELGCKVVAIEPNVEMLEECKAYCSLNSNIQCIFATAEETSLKDNSVDIITIAQAFHWFDKKLCKKEFKRILKEHGYVLTIWNSLEEDMVFEREYMNILHQYEIKTTAGNSYFDPDKEKLEFLGQDFVKVYYDNYQDITLEELICNASSRSYTPSKVNNEYDSFTKALKELFVKYEEGGKVTFHYKTEISIGQFAK